MSKKENMIVKTNFIVIFVLLLNLVFSNFKNFVFASPITIEAENYSSQSGCTIAKNYPGYSGSGFLDYGGQNSYGEWNVNVSSAGEYDLKIRYANGSTSNRQCELKVNGIVIGNIPFTKTSSWSNWLVTTVTINLSSGNNTVRITANTSSGGPNIDKFDISASSGVIVFTTTSDGRIMKEGQEFVVKGVNANGPHWAYSRATIPDVPLMKTWGFNTVRVLCYPRLAYNGVNNNTDLDGIIDAITSRGMVAIIENHDTTGVYLSTQPVYTQDQWGNNIRYP